MVHSMLLLNYANSQQPPGSNKSLSQQAVEEVQLTIKLSHLNSFNVSLHIRMAGLRILIIHLYTGCAAIYL